MTQEYTGTYAGFRYHCDEQSRHGTVRKPELLLTHQLCDPLKAHSQQKNFSYFAHFFLSLAMLQQQATFISVVGFLLLQVDDEQK